MTLRDESTYTTLKCYYCGEIISNHSVLGEVYIFHKDCLSAWYNEEFLLDD